MKRGYTGTYHMMCGRHLNRYGRELTGRFNDRELDAAYQMIAMVRGRLDKKLRCAELKGAI